MAKRRIKFFTDHNVPESVGSALLECGHKLTRLRTVLAPDTKDPIVALASADGGHVLVTFDSDFREIAKRLNLSRKQATNQLHYIRLRCEPVGASERVKEVIDLLEYEWSRCVRSGTALCIEVLQGTVRIDR